MLISEKSRMVTYLFLSCYVNEIPLSSSYKKVREILGADYFSYLLDHSSLTAGTKHQSYLGKIIHSWGQSISHSEEQSLTAGAKHQSQLGKIHSQLRQNISHT